MQTLRALPILIINATHQYQWPSAVFVKRSYVKKCMLAMDSTVYCMLILILATMASTVCALNLLVLPEI